MFYTKSIYWRERMPINEYKACSIYTWFSESSIYQINNIGKNQNFPNEVSWDDLFKILAKKNISALCVHH